MYLNLSYNIAITGFYFKDTLLLHVVAAIELEVKMFFLMSHSVYYTHVNK